MAQFPQGVRVYLGVDHRICLITRTDVHISDHTPQSRTDDWTETVLDKLGQVGDIARSAKADAVLDNGDFFDVKSPGRNSHALVRRVAEVQAKYPCITAGNVGNHDCVYGNIDFLDQQPLGVLFATGVFERCYGDHELLIARNSGFSVRVVGIPYHGPNYDLERFKLKKGNESFLVAMAHVLASPKGGSMFEGEDIVKYDDLISLAPDVDVWVLGHWHKDQGIVEHKPGKWIVNIGSLTRGSLSQDDLDRKPGVSILTFSDAGDIRVQRRDLKIRPPGEIFDLERRVQQETRAMTMDAFVSSLQETLAEAGDSESLDQKIDKLDVPNAVRERAVLYLERARVDD